MTAFKRMTAGLLAGALLLSFCGCSEEEKSSVSDAADDIGYMAQEDMPYGSTISVLKEAGGKVTVGIEYDNRFLTEEEAIKVSDYIAALGNADDALMRETVYDGYLDAIAEKENYADLKAYLDECVNVIEADYIGEEFSFNYAMINSCVDKSNADYAERFVSIDAALQSICGDLNITDRKMITVEIMYTHTAGGGSYSLSQKQQSDTTLFVYTIDGEPYIVI